MKIVALLHYYIEENRAGGEMMLHRILKELAKEHDVTALITSTVKLNSEIDGVKVIYAATKDTLATYEYDLIITHFANAPIAITDAHARGKQVAYVAHNDKAETQLHLNMLTKDDYAIYNTNWIRNKFTTQAKAFTIHPPVDLKDFKTTPGDHITLVNLTPQKGSQVFYELARRMPDEKFLAVGGGYWKDRQIFQDLPNVTYQENTPDMTNDVYARTKILLVGSDYETYGMVAREAGVSGIPVICTPTDGLKENLVDAGIYVNFGNTDGYELEIRKLHDPKAYKSASKAIKDHIRLTTHDEITPLLEELRNANQ